ncbi:peptidylprolyl isomerase [Sphingomonas flavalba]|uniref:peptidylprolyl isomerase n=1 Tax=Sphingomonas flavalba TaxID=2559804 RepID=UPI0039E143AD
MLLSLLAATAAAGLSPTDIVAQAPAEAWRDIAPADLLVMTLADGGTVTIQLAPGWAPVHVANIATFATARFWDGAGINRVQDNYVVQWGDATRAAPAAVQPTPPAEYQRPLAGTGFRPLGFPDAYARQTGHAGGWPVATDGKGNGWLVHCYGMVGVGRDMSPDTGTGAELYAVIGHAPRHLDRNIALVGRVIDGIERLSALPRGTDALGIYADAAQHVPIASIRRGDSGTTAPAWQYLATDSPTFAAYATARANRQDAFFNLPAGGADICNVPVPLRRKPGG